MWPECVKTTEVYARCVALNRPVTITVKVFQLQGDYLGKQDVSNYRASSVFSKRVPCYFSYLFGLDNYLLHTQLWFCRVTWSQTLMGAN
jgi:hypothetical protein